MLILKIHRVLDFIIFYTNKGEITHLLNQRERNISTKLKFPTTQKLRQFVFASDTPPIVQDNRTMLLSLPVNPAMVSNPRPVTRTSLSSDAEIVSKPPNSGSASEPTAHERLAMFDYLSHLNSYHLQKVDNLLDWML